MSELKKAKEATCVMSGGFISDDGSMVYEPGGTNSSDEEEKSHIGFL
jgi:hypothetical protein